MTEPTPPDRVPVTAETLCARLGGVGDVTAQLGTDISTRQVREVGDGNLNLVFTDPCFEAEMNRHTPGLDPWVDKLRTDRDMRAAAQAMKMAFVSRGETLAHGDLHSGPIMVTAEDSRVIDPEFAVCAPFGFDVGMLLAAGSDGGDMGRFRGRVHSSVAVRTHGDPASKPSLRRQGRCDRLGTGAASAVGANLARHAGLLRSGDAPPHPWAGPYRGPGKHYRRTPPRHRPALAQGRHPAVNREAIPGIGAACAQAMRIEKEDLS